MPGAGSAAEHSDGKLITLTDLASIVATLSYDEAGMIRSVMDGAGRVTTLTVDDAGDLVSVLTHEL